jgi:hypothetical protein
MKITEDELDILITESTGDREVRLSFGADVELRDEPANDWAKQRIKEIRK